MVKFWALLLYISWAHRMFVFFRGLGALGLFLLGVGDSSFLFVPLSNDLLLIALVSGNRDSWHWIAFTLAASLGSMVGVLLVDLVMRKAGEEGLEKFVGPKKLEKLKKKVGDRGAWAVFLAALLPPPFPFTAVVAAASALQTARRGMLLAVLSGRLIRFTIESVLALYFGRRLLRYLRSEVVEYFVYALIAVAIVGSILTIHQWLRTRTRQPAPAA
jgi:undecaprenyl-diphosphatase